ncbi:hypothetical protein TNCV_3500671 [Trichonephila clavipes]|nr:hypothetical protein TNCV_3500671 [Trichonephila clavipes]
MNETTQQEKTTQLSSRNEQLNSAAGTKQLNSALPSTAYNRLHRLYSRIGFFYLLTDEAHFWLNGYVNKQNCRIWSEANPQVYVETPLHPEKLTVWCALWAGGILLQKR